MSTQYYSIKVGVAKPQLVEMGEINKSTGMPAGQTEKAESVVGRITIPNFSKIYAKRTLDEKGQPAGPITPLPWGHPEGEVIEIRYMSNCQYLDKQFQELRKLNFSEQEAEISLMYGINHFDPSKQKALVDMLKLHTYNGDNPSRDPNNQNIKYRNYDPKKEINEDKKKYMDLSEAMALLNSIKEEPKRLQVMALAFGVDEKLPDDDIILKLMQRAHHDPGKFLGDKAQHHQKVQQVLYRALDLQVISVDTPKEITMIATGNSVIGGFNKLEGNKKLDFLVDNAFEPRCADAIEDIRLALSMRESQLS